MNRKYFLLIAFLAALILAVYSCDGSSNNVSSVSEEWIDYQDKVYKSMEDSDFTKLQCLTGNGILYYKSINNFKPVTSKPSTSFGVNTKVSESGYPTYGDSVRCRYLGWYYYEDKDGNRKKCYFDGTETSKPDYEFNKEDGVVFNINKNLTSGFLSMLQYMKAGDQIRVAIPYQLGYGVNGINTNKVSILGYTTLFFDIYLMRIYPRNPDEYPGVNLGEGNH